MTDAIQMLEQVIVSVPVAEIPGLVGNLERLKSISLLRMIEAPRQDQQPESVGTPPLLDAQQVAKHLNVPKSFVYEAARQGKLKPVKLGEKYVRFTQGTVEEYLAKSGA